MYTRTYSWLDSSEATLCFGTRHNSQEGLVDLSTFNHFRREDSERLLSRFETASKIYDMRKIWRTDTFLVLMGLARRYYTNPIYYWEQPKPYSMKPHREEGYEVLDECWHGEFTVVHLWTPIIVENPGRFGLVGHLQMAITQPIDFEKLRNILRGAGGTELLWIFAGQAPLDERKRSLIEGILESVTS